MTCFKVNAYSHVLYDELLLAVTTGHRLVEQAHAQQLTDLCCFGLQGKQQHDRRLHDLEAAVALRQQQRQQS